MPKKFIPVLVLSSLILLAAGCNKTAPVQTTSPQSSNIQKNSNTTTTNTQTNSNPQLTYENFEKALANVTTFDDYAKLVTQYGSSAFNARLASKTAGMSSADKKDAMDLILLYPPSIKHVAKSEMQGTATATLTVATDEPNTVIAATLVKENGVWKIDNEQISANQSCTQSGTAWICK